MKLKTYCRVSTLTAIIASGCGEPPQRFPELSGPYLGQTPPGSNPEVFAPGIVSTGMFTRDITITPEGDEIYFGTSVGPFTTIIQTKLVDGRWTEPQVAPFASDPNYMNLEPHITPDGQRFLFLSNRPRDGGPLPDDQAGTWVNQDLWVMDRVGDGWGEPYNLGPPVNSDDEEYFPSVTRDGTIYFTRTPAGTRESYIYRSRRVDGEYQEPERLGPEINSTATQYNAFIAPDESYMIVSVFGREDGLGGSDYYVVFRNQDDSWSGPVNLGERINLPQGAEWSSYVSPDGRYLFFMSTRRMPPAEFPTTLSVDFLRQVFQTPRNGNPSIYWVDAGFLRELRPEASTSASEREAGAG